MLFLQSYIKQNMYFTLLNIYIYTGCINQQLVWKVFPIKSRPASRRIRCRHRSSRARPTRNCQTIARKSFFFGKWTSTIARTFHMNSIVSVLSEEINLLWAFLWKSSVELLANRWRDFETQFRARTADDLNYGGGYSPHRLEVRRELVRSETPFT